MEKLDDLTEEVMDNLIEATHEAANDGEGSFYPRSFHAALVKHGTLKLIGQMFQRRVHKWMVACFPPEVVADPIERGFRFYEESTELMQATGITREQCHTLVDYVFNRPAGLPKQELGGVVITLHALANAANLDVQDAGETELARIWQNIDKIRAKHFSKPANILSALPGTEPSK